MIDRKVTRWKLNNSPATLNVRAGAWEVSYSLDGKELQTVIFSGSEARKLSEAYENYIRDYLAADDMLA